jgi:hypothetical protein
MVGRSLDARDSHMTPTRLGRMLRLLRAADQRDMRSLAAEIGISSATLCRLEAGRSCDVATWLRLQAWLLAAHESR